MTPEEKLAEIKKAVEEYRHDCDPQPYKNHDPEYLLEDIERILE